MAAIRTEVEALRARLVEAEAGLEKAAASLAEKQSALDETQAAHAQAKAGLFELNASLATAENELGERIPTEQELRPTEGVLETEVRAGDLEAAGTDRLAFDKQKVDSANVSPMKSSGRELVSGPSPTQNDLQI